jgi:hypothetical protein
MDNTKTLMNWDQMTETAPPTVKDYALRLKKVPQSYNWHPEGNVETHTRIVLRRCSWFENIDLVITAFFHDLGKVDTTKPNGKGGFSAHGHEDISADLVRYNRDWIKDLGGDPQKVEWLVKNHMRVKYFDEMKQKKRKELINSPWFSELMEFKACDSREGLDLLEVLGAKGNPFTFLFNRLKTFFLD